MDTLSRLLVEISILLAASRSNAVSVFRDAAPTYKVDIWVEDAEGFPRDRSLIPVLATHVDQPGSWFALSNLGVFSKEPTDTAWACLTALEDWRDVHPTALAILNL